MRSKFFFFILFSSLVIAAFAQQKPKLAVYVTGDDPINELIGNELQDGLAHNGKYTTVERTADFLKAMSKEHGYQRSGEVDDEQIAALGKQFAVQYVCVASVSSVWNNEKYISARIIDVESAEVVASGNSFGAINTTQSLISTMDGLSKSLLKALDYFKTSGAKKVAVYVTKSGNRDVDIILGDQLVAGFAKSGKYIAIERTNRFLSELTKEQGYQQSGAVADEDLVRLGKQAGVQYVCVAKTTNWNGDYFISSRLIDVEQGNIVNSSNEKGIKLNNANDVVNLTEKIAKRLSGLTIEEANRMCEDLQKRGYVDLGLPSGTMWKNINEAGFFRNKEAFNKYGNLAPTQDQWDELSSKCKWTISDNTIKVTGPNGNSITLPEGHYDISGDVIIYIGWVGGYEYAPKPKPNENCMGMLIRTQDGLRYGIDSCPCDGFSIRLVQNKYSE